MEHTVASFVFDPQMNYQALAVLAWLSGQCAQQAGAEWNDEFEQYDYRQVTAAWHNCREQGFVLSVSRDFGDRGKVINFAVAENRNSDNIVVYHWVSDGDLNPPTIANMTDETWSSKRYFLYGEIKETADWIMQQIEGHLTLTEIAAKK